LHVVDKTTGFFAYSKIYLRNWIQGEPWFLFCTLCLWLSYYLFSVNAERERERERKRERERERERERKRGEKCGL
jgi:hypothetical protein